MTLRSGARTGFFLLLCVVFPAAFLLTGNLLPMVYVDDRLAHGSLYALAAVLAGVGWGRRIGAGIGLGLVLVGVAIEGLQWAFPTGHEVEWGDVVANGVGVAIGYAAALCIAVAAERRQRPGRP